MLVRLDSTQLTVTEAPLAFAGRHADAIADHWTRWVAAQPRLWNGPQFLFTDVQVRDGVLHGTAHRTDYAAFLYWRDHRRDGSAVHITGSSLPVTADGAIVAARMADHTANAGQVYFPAGSLDPGDVCDGRIDITANIRREMAEETGLAPPLADFDAAMMAATGDHAWHVARRCRLAMSFAECAARVHAHQRATGEDEVAGLVAIRVPEDADRLRPYARALALWHFDQAERGE
ncbi:MAG: NUDIX hydrolase [Roseitalea sp.]|jgi:8-oxo-dGTP pyrophosphatase MutT (NUDIX family)|nr:NUDIX hydrolase [Roseitalea sp.]MBO6721245.1 NUDIX hydrolase [Roseitalea sp.]MBO6742271.1 NUDIX hydrolase [Roseitalea sp.]